MPTWIERQPAQRLRPFRRKRGDNLVEARIAAQRVAAYLAVLAAARDLLGLIFNAEQTKAGFQQASRTNFSCCVTRNFCAALFANSYCCDPGCFSSQSFWKRGSFRSGSNIGSSRSSAGVIGGRLWEGIESSFCKATMARSGSPI
jgi:hypothetical protein